LREELLKSSPQARVHTGLLRAVCARVVGTWPNPNDIRIDNINPHHSSTIFLRNFMILIEASLLNEKPFEPLIL
jgi:hypothetical protein